MIQFKRIAEPHTYGYAATVGDRSAEILRSYPGDWFIYAKLDGKVCKARCDERRPMSYAACLREARQFINGKLTYEVWP